MHCLLHHTFSLSNQPPSNLPISHCPLDHEPVSLLQLPRSSNVNPLHIRSLLKLLQVTLRKRDALVLQACQTLVVSLEQEAVNDATNARNTSQCDDDSHRRVVKRCRPVKVGERCPDGGSIAKAVDESERGGTFGWWARDGVCDPGVCLLFVSILSCEIGDEVGLTVPFMAKMNTMRKREK